MFIPPILFTKTQLLNTWPECEWELQDYVQVGSLIGFILTVQKASSISSFFFMFFLCWRKIIFLVISLQKLERNSRNNVRSFHWCYLIIRIGDKCYGICCTQDDVARFCFVPYNLLSVKKNHKTNNQTNPQKLIVNWKNLHILEVGWILS